MSFLHVDKLYKINHVCHTYKLLSLKCKNNILNLNLYYYYYCNNNFMLTSVLYKCFYCIVINSYICNIFIHTLTPLSLSLKGKKQYLCLSHAHTYAFIHASVRLSVIKHTNPYTRSCHSHTRDGGGGVSPGGSMCDWGSGRFWIFVAWQGRSRDRSSTGCCSEDSPACLQMLHINTKHICELYNRPPTHKSFPSSVNWWRQVDRPFSMSYALSGHWCQPLVLGSVT